MMTENDGYNEANPLANLSGSVEGKGGSGDTTDNRRLEGNLTNTRCRRVRVRWMVSLVPKKRIKRDQTTRQVHGARKKNNREREQKLLKRS